MELSEVDDDPGPVALNVENTLPHQIDRWADTDPDRPFLTEADGVHRQSYGGFRTATRQWARLLVDHDVRPGDRVVSLLPSSVDAHALWIAASLIGAIEVPVNPALRGEFLRHVLTDSGATLCVVRPEQVTIIRESGVAGLRTLVAPRERPLPFDVAPLVPDELPGVDDVSCVIYTSGTTGPAKGVVITWGQMAASIGRLPRSWLGSDDVVYSPWPMFHVTGRTPMFAMCDVGGQVVLREKFSLSSFWSDVRRHGCTSTTVTTVASLLVAQPESGTDRDHPLRYVFFGRVGPDGLRFLDRFGIRGVACYGSTEVGFPIVNRSVTADTRDIAGWLRRGYHARIVDIEGRDVDPGVVGELWIRPPDRRLMMREYLNHPQRTAEAVVDGWYRTGDAVRRTQDDGFIFVDRMRDTIRRFGENISSSALESVVLGDAEVLECAAVGVPSQVTGQDVLLAVVAVPGIEIDPAALSSRLAAQLPRYMRPSFIAVVGSLPKTPNGKIRKIEITNGIDLGEVWSAERDPPATMPGR